MADFAKESSILITCPKNITPVLAREVEELGYQITNTGFAFVEINGSLNDCMRLNLWLRTAHKVLYKLKDFMALGPDLLYDNLKLINWEDYISEDGYFTVTSKVLNDRIRDTRFANLRVKDAIVDRISDKKGKRPDTGPDKSQSVVFLHWENEKASVFLDTSGETIAKHGYRKLPHKAPMQETLAAAVVLASRWQQGTTFINPMCGSGTLAIEAALIATNTAPGLLRDNFGFMHIEGFPMFDWRAIRESAENEEKKLEGQFILSDIDPKAVQAARKNAQLAGFENFFEFEVCPFEKTEIPQENKGIVIVNPEYGERLGDVESSGPLYTAIGDFFKQECKGYTGYIFTGNPELAKKIGLRPKRKIPFYNGPIESRLLEFELYEGSKKAKYNL